MDGGADRVLIVSCDSHAGPTPEAARSYFESKYEDDLQRYEDETDNYGRVLNAFLAGAMDPDAMSETMTVVDPEGIIASGGQLGAFDPQRRLLEMDREGVAAEVLLIGHQLAPPPFCGVVNTPYPAELRAAGTTAYHRWLVDHVAADPKRLLGVAEAGPCLDMEATVRELRWVAEHGFIAAHLPGTVYDAALPPLYDPYYEPYWSTCAELGLTLLIHVGYGKPQGETINFLARCAEVATKAQSDASGGSLKMVEEMINSPDSPFAPDLVPRRAIWQLMLSGVFDRHPELRLQVTEMRADWVPSTLAALDRRFEEDDTPLSMKPSDYWKRNCFTCPSSIHRSEVAMREEIGVSQMLFGRDYPHPESTWPNTRDWIRDAFIGVPEAEIRMILGENAVRCHRLLDRESLLEIAGRVGPRLEDIFGISDPVNAALLDTFDTRAAYRRPPETVDLVALEDRFGEDLQGVSVSAVAPGQRGQ